MRPIETRYALSGEVRIAYQVVGQGSFDLVFVPGFISNLDLHWEDEVIPDSCGGFRPSHG
ncbi:hypothetical protein [Mesorhizobium sp. M8A.F.Ca.ET.161.01.1.1]|uniref:hypothetical protein n=1 Tax=Mesorhizobium sp. M8A.F.Ca.ET.161.01.1.1 TaxID=2563959 RepID=UPI001FEF68E5|nr:hypothetical protein [Mesorhizobium sp. M8A.F.Ca.ET.161.01.1.1]